MSSVWRLGLFAGGCCLQLLSAAGAGAPARPNVVVMLTDDQGIGDLTCYNSASRVQTPHLDRLAAEGLRFLNAYAPASVCSPTRYGLMTGRYPWRTWHKEGVLYPYDPSLIRPGRLTLGSLFQQLGYATIGSGKWHLGIDWPARGGDPGDWNHGQQIRAADMSRIARRVDFSQAIRVGPNQLGFDDYFGTVHQGIDGLVIHNSRRVEGFRTRPDDHDDLFWGHAEKSIREHRRLQPDRPFFLYLALGSPHAGRGVPERWKGRSGDGVRGDRIQWADEILGRVCSLLDELGLAQETLVVFTSDNGATSAMNRPDRSPEHRPNGPWRGFKTDVWDGGCRVPLIARWPGRIEPGRTAEPMVCLTDLLATFADLGGVELPEWAGEDSFSFRSALFGSEKPVRDHVILQSYTGILSLREPRWKLILGTEGSGGHQGLTPGWTPNQSGWNRITTTAVGQLYDMQSDPGETENRFSREPETVARMRARLETLVLADRSRPAS